VLARAFDRDPELPAMLHRIVIMGGAWHEPGNASASAEFHFYCDPPAAQRVLHCDAPVTLVPLDAMRKLLFSPSDLLGLPAPQSRTSRFLGKIGPHGIGATASLYGVEGFHLKDVLGVVAVRLPELLTVKPMVVDVETRGELTRGMSVVDVRWGRLARANVDMVVGVDVQGVRDYVQRTLTDSI
jgi:inosine-uridine nucleoside N-ribohydrolase